MLGKKTSIFESLIVVVVVLLSVLLGLGLYAGRAKTVKSGMLIQELSMMRSAALHYRIVNRKLPASLDELASSTYATDLGSRPYIDRLPQTSGSKFLDPFGSPYNYDAGSGWIGTTTSGMERW